MSAHEKKGNGKSEKGTLMKLLRLFKFRGWNFIRKLCSPNDEKGSDKVSFFLHFTIQFDVLKDEE